LTVRPLRPETLRTLVGSSSIVFQGKVEALGKSNLDGVEANERMAMVKIDKVVYAPMSLGDLTGQTVTVHLRSPNGIKQDQQVTIFGAPFHYGNNIGLTEVGRTDLTADQVRQSTIDERLRQLDEQLKERIKSAKLIVSGSVRSTDRSESTEGLPGMEEGVNWEKALLRPETVVKGIPPSDLSIYFPEEKSGEKSFGPIPRYNTGQKGVWLLRSPEFDEDIEQKSRKPEREEDVLIAQDPLDYHAICELPRIEALFWSLYK
jgi:hypothetical protein